MALFSKALRRLILNLVVIFLIWEMSNLSSALVILIHSCRRQEVIYKRHSLHKKRVGSNLATRSHIVTGFDNIDHRHFNAKQSTSR